MKRALDEDAIKNLLKKADAEEARKSVRYLHTHSGDRAVMIDAVQKGLEGVYFERRRRYYSITYATNEVGERTANFQPLVGFIPCGTYVIDKLLTDGYE